MKYLVLGVLLLILPMSFLRAQPYPYEQSWLPVKNLFEKIVGTWQLQGENEFETWTLDDNQFTGRGWAIEGNDTIIREYLKLFYKYRQVVYQATVPDQNKGEPVNFKLAYCRGNTASFRNPEHDFPQEILYHLIDKNTLEATIIGEKGGNTNSTILHFKRVE